MITEKRNLIFYRLEQRLVLTAFFASAFCVQGKIEERFEGHCSCAQNVIPFQRIQALKLKAYLGYVLTTTARQNIQGFKIKIYILSTESI